MLPSVDHVDPHLHRVFLKELARKQLALIHANQGLQTAVTLLISYLCLSAGIVLVLKLPMFHTPSGFHYYGLRYVARFFDIPTAAAAVTALNIGLVLIVLLFWWQMHRRASRSVSTFLRRE
jgi:hypothetical protein